MSDHGPAVSGPDHDRLGERGAGAVHHPAAPAVRRAALLALLALLALAAACPAGAAPDDPLWLQAVASSARAKEWSPGEMRLAMEMADDAGKVLETWDYRYRIFQDADGAVRTEVVSAFHDGKDETQKERAAQAKRDREAGPGGSAAWSRYLDNPFDPAAQDDLEATRLALAREIEGVSCLAFDFSLARPKNMRVAGTAWLDAATGLPVEVVSAPSPLPPAVRELVTTVRYAGGSVSEVRVEGSGSLLFFKRRFVTVITLGGWFRIGT